MAPAMGDTGNEQTQKKPNKQKQKQSVFSTSPILYLVLDDRCVDISVKLSHTINNLQFFYTLYSMIDILVKLLYTINNL